MRRLKIKAVYWVDDENSVPAEQDSERLISAFADAFVAGDEAERKTSLATLLKSDSMRDVGQQIQRIGKSDDDDLAKTERVIAELRKFLGTVTDPKAILLEMLQKLPGPLSPQEKEELTKLFRETDDLPWSWAALSFSSWNNAYKNILNRHSVDEAALLIVDLQNGREATSLDGYEVLKQVAMAGVSRLSCHVIVLTSACSSKEEFRSGRKLTEDIFDGAQDKRVPVFVVSKSRFSDEQNGDAMVSAFANVLARADLSLLHLQLSREVHDHLVSSLDIAANALDRLTIEELMFAVTHTSTEEGVPEIETLARITAIAQREAFQRAIVESASLRQTLIELRNAEISIDRSHLSDDRQIIQLRFAELYDKPEAVNGLFSAIAPGDLYSVRQMQSKPTGEGGLPDDAVEAREDIYVLVANACDLMLRPTGERNLAVGILLRLNEGASKSPFSFELPHLDLIPLSGSSVKSLDLRQFVAVPLELLDLCWTSSDGTCSWSNAEPDGLLPKLIKSQRERYNILLEYFSGAKREDLSALAFPLAASCEIVVEGDERVARATFGVRRVGRLSYAHASQLVHRFAGAFGRPSAEHDFAKHK